jgi:hypothetical protein
MADGSIVLANECQNTELVCTYMTALRMVELTLYRSSGLYGVEVVRLVSTHASGSRHTLRSPP